MTVFEEAVVFALKAHAGTTRKAEKTPAVLHSLETAAVAGSMTDDPELLAAAVLHDTVEDTPTTLGDLREAFGARVAALVASETEGKRAELPPADSWQLRKAESLEVLKRGSIEVKILWLSDKLSNMRSFYRLWEKEGASLWRRFHQSDPARQAWYYRGIAEYTAELSGTAAWREYVRLVDLVFGGTEKK